MTEPETIPRHPTAVQQRVAWFSIACAVASLAVSISVRVAGGHVRWTAWALPPLIAANPIVLFLGGLNRWPRLVPIYMFLSLALAAAIVAAETLAFVRR
jgi:hypothetical protein